MAARRSKFSIPRTSSTPRTSMTIDPTEQLENVTPSSSRLRRAKSSTMTQAVQRQDKNSGKKTPLRLPRKRKSSPMLGKRSMRLIGESYDSNLYIKYPELKKLNFEVTGQRDKRSFSLPLTRLRLMQFLNEQRAQNETQETATTRPDAKQRRG